MSCSHAMHLEAVASGEASPALAADVEAHARACQRCRQELQWLRTEHAMFRLRAGRDEVAHLWSGVARRRRFERPRAWGRLLGGVAAAAALAVGLAAWSPSGPGAPLASPAGEPWASEDAMSFSRELQPCSRLPEGLGFHCAPALQASTIASR